MNQEQAVMRTSVRASVLQTVASNLRRHRGTVAIFEAARAYMTEPNDLPKEREVVVGAIAGMRGGRWGEAIEEPVDYFDAKGMVEETLERAAVDAVFRAGEEYSLLRGRTAELLTGEDRVGVLGQVHPQVAAQFDIEVPVYLFELDVEKLLAGARGRVRHAAQSRFPAVIQDIALLVEAKVAAGDVTRAIASSSLVAEAQLFDVYEGAPLPEGKRSLAYQVQFQSLEKTLTDEDVAQARNRLVRRLAHEFGAELRGG
jgi:phenylalanyl-tRNA synthetase beta chain